jgi:hypothetical protein
LERVIGIVHRPHHPVAVGVERCPMRFDEAAERLLVVVH